MIGCDYVIVGGGAAGSVLAARLSEDPGLKVVLIEAGRDVHPKSVPADIASIFPLSSFNPSYTWPGLKVHWRGRSNSPAEPFAQGRIIGGGSTIMGMWALRGVPGDYDAWARDGATGWAWQDVLPFFRKLEADQDFDGDLHGKAGPLPIRRQARQDWSPLAQAMQAAAAKQGFPVVADMNADFRDGYCVLPITRYANHRASAAICYLTAAVRSRPNLRLLTDTTARRLTTEGKRVTGVVAERDDGSAVSLRARRTIVTAGAIYSPALLMRSGIGPGQHLRAVGVEVKLERMGVGRNLQNHPLLPAVAWLKRGGRDAGRGRPPASTYLRWSSNTPGTPPGDVGMYIRSYLVWHALGRHMAMVGPVLMKPQSRGDVRLDDIDPLNAVSVAFKFFDHPGDLGRMMDGFRRTASMLADPALRPVCGDAFVLRHAARLNRYNSLSRMNGVRGWTASVLMDLSPSLGGWMFSRLAEMQPLASLVDDEAGLADFITNNAFGTNHVTGTCRMGRDDDPLAVVDPDGRAIGMDGLFVADASIMPSVPSGNTHLATVMVAEKIAAGLQTRFAAAAEASASRVH